MTSCPKLAPSGHAIDLFMSGGYLATPAAPALVLCMIEQQETVVETSYSPSLKRLGNLIDLRQSEEKKSKGPQTDQSKSMKRMSQACRLPASSESSGLRPEEIVGSGATAAKEASLADLRRRKTLT